MTVGLFIVVMLFLVGPFQKTGNDLAKAIS